MMFVQFFIWGAWYVTAPNYLGTIGFTSSDFQWTYSVGPIAGMISPFFVGMIADRFFPAQFVMGILHIGGGLLMMLAANIMVSDNPDPEVINWIFLGHMLCYFPTLALSNTISMKNITDTEKVFPLIRVFGTIGWIAAGVFLSMRGWSIEVTMFQLTAWASIALGVFSFILPHTPPETGSKPSLKEIIGLDALVLFKDKAYLIFMACSLLICIPLSFYYQIGSRVVELINPTEVAFLQPVQDLLQLKDAIGATMAFGQISEIFFMLIMPLFFKRLGVKWMLAVGMLAWVIRYALFSFGAPPEVFWMVFVGILLHGICYDFFFVTGQIYTDKVAPKAIRGQAQGLLVFFTLGLGMLIGAQLAGIVDSKFTPKGEALVEMADDPENLERMKQQLGDEEEAQQVIADWRVIGETETKIAAIDEQLVSTSAGSEQEASLLQEKDGLSEIIASKGRSKLRSKGWDQIWGIPAIFALVILVVFVVLFPNKPKFASEPQSEDSDDVGHGATIKD